MEEIINEENYMEQLYQIMGGESQFLQLILMPNQQIITNESSIQYMSEKLQVKSKYTMRERLKQVGQVFTGQRKLDFIVENLSNSVEYVGLTQNSGRILVIEPQITEQLLVLEPYVLAHTNNIDLVLNKSYKGRQFFGGRNKQFYKLITKHQLPFMFEDFLQDQSDNIKPLANQYRDTSKQAKELVFLHSNGKDRDNSLIQIKKNYLMFMRSKIIVQLSYKNIHQNNSIIIENIIEKTLGTGEKIIVHKDCVIGFQDSITFSSTKGDVYQGNNYVTIEGPGLVLIETAIADNGFIARNLSKREATR